MTDIQSIAARAAHLPVDQRLLLTTGLEDSIALVNARSTGQTAQRRLNSNPCLAQGPH